jgi:hypothetical protein
MLDSDSKTEPVYDEENDMKNKYVFLIVGIALVCTIAIGGWGVTNVLLDQKEEALFAEGGSVETGTSEETSDTVTVNYGNAAGLTASEMAIVLRDMWVGQGERTPHEPTAGQISMEQAIGQGRTWLNTLVNKGLMPEEVLDYEQVNAYLEKRVPRNMNFEEMGYSGYNPLFNPADVRDDEMLEPFFSYWTVIFSGTEARTRMVMNAVTGQVWSADIIFGDKDVGEVYAGLKDDILAYFIEQSGSADFVYDFSSGLTQIGLVQFDGRAGACPPLSGSGDESISISMELTVRLYEPKPLSELADIIGAWTYSHSTKTDGVPFTIHEFQFVTPTVEVYEEVTDIAYSGGTSLIGNVRIHLYESIAAGTAFLHEIKSHSYSYTILSITTIAEGQVESTNREDSLLYNPDDDTLRYHIDGADVYHYFVRG